MNIPMQAGIAAATGGLSVPFTSGLFSKKGGAPFVSGLRDETGYATQEFNKLFGRDPSEAELAEIVPSYVGTDQHIANVAQGNSYVAQMYNSQYNSPANLYARQQQQWQAAAPQHYDSVGQIFNSTLGREATQDELSHYGTLIASGQADPYQIQQFLQATPEYQNAQDTKFRQGLDTQLQSSDENFFNRAKGDITQQYALMGRATSPALDVALTDMASQLNDKRQNYLAQLSASQYGGNKSSALSDYQNTQDQVQGQINQNTQGIYQNNQNLMNRNNQFTDYNTQNMAWQQANSAYNNRPLNGLDYLNTGLNAAKTVGQTYAAFNGK